MQSSCLRYGLSLQVEAEPGKFSCSLCSTVCKTKCGLTRHTNSKHKPKVSDAGDKSRDDHVSLQLPNAVFEEIVEQSVRDLAADQCFPSEFREQFIGFAFVLPCSDDDKWKGISEMQKLYQCLMSRGNAEQFYSKFYAIVIPHFRNLFSQFSSQGATLVSTRIANKVIAYSKQKGTAEWPAKTVLTVNEKYALQYLGGYVLSKLNRKIQFTKRQHSLIGQQCISFLQAGKANKFAHSHAIVDSVNRGGLWKVNSNVEQILTQAELKFLEHTRTPNTKQINVPAMVNALTSNQDVIANYQSWCSLASLVLDQEVSDEMLERVLTFYLRERAFSYAKDVVNNFKSKQSKSKSKALRKEIQQRTCKAPN